MIIDIGVRGQWASSQRCNDKCHAAGQNAEHNKERAKRRKVMSVSLCAR